MRRVLLCLLSITLAVSVSGCAYRAITSDSESVASLSGVVTYLPRVALPPDARVEVRLLDVSRADAPADTLAERSFPTDGEQVPIEFTLHYRPADIEPRHRYVVRAEIRDSRGELRWTTNTAIPVLTNDAPTDDVEIRVVQLSPPSKDSAASVLVGPTWRLVRILRPEAEAVLPSPEESNTVTFDVDGQLSGQADCNRFTGSFSVKGDRELTIGQVGATLAACAGPSAGDAFVRRLGDVASFSLNDGWLRLYTAQGSVLVLERQDEVSEQAHMAPQRAGRTFVFDCQASSEGGFRFITRTGAGETALWLPQRFGGRYLVLGQTRAASGARYEGGGVVFWNKGDEALLEVDGTRYSGCELDKQQSPWADARLSGVDFRAVGQEPGWVLEIREGRRIRFVYDYGEQQATTPAPEPVVNERAERTRYHARTEAHELTVTITEEPCTDAMNGAHFEASVRVELDGETYQGCGRRLHQAG